MRFLLKAIIAVVLLNLVEFFTGVEIFFSFNELALENVVLDLACFTVAWGIAILVMKLIDAVLQSQQASMD